MHLQQENIMRFLLINIIYVKPGSGELRETNPLIRWTNLDFMVLCNYCGVWHKCTVLPLVLPLFVPLS